MINTTIESLCTELGIGFYFANLDEANVIVDKLNKMTDFPVLVLLPYILTDSVDNAGAVHTTMPFEAFLLTKITQLTHDVSSVRAQDEAVTPMLTLARSLMAKINASNIIDMSTPSRSFGIQRVVYTPTYSTLDAGLHGVNISCEVPVN